MSKDFKVGDWFTLKGSDEVYQIERFEDERVVYEDERSMEVVVPVEWLEEAESPTPKLEKRMAQPEVWAKPDEVQKVLDELNLIINPPSSLAGDWEALHGMEDEAFRRAIDVMIKYPEWRDRILHKMKIVRDLYIPRW